jgi:hypothetical protein
MYPGEWDESSRRAYYKPRKERTRRMRNQMNTTMEKFNADHWSGTASTNFDIYQQHPAM